MPCVTRVYMMLCVRAPGGAGDGGWGEAKGNRHLQYATTAVSTCDGTHRYSVHSVLATEASTSPSGLCCDLDRFRAVLCSDRIGHQKTRLSDCVGP